ncbi:MAG: phosphate ABC transporter permease PstA [Gammaproteobacteria bacterium]
MTGKFKTWLDSGAPWIWLNAGMVSVALIMIVSLLLFLAVRGMGHFWPSQIVAFESQNNDGSVEKVLGEIVDHETLSATRLKELGMKPPPGESRVDRVLLKTGNRDISGIDFRWFARNDISNQTVPHEAMELERTEWGNFIGFPVTLKENGKEVSAGGDLLPALQERLARRNKLEDQIDDIQRNRIGHVNYQLESIRLQERADTNAGNLDAQAKQNYADARQLLQVEYESLTKELSDLNQQIMRDTLVMRTVDDKSLEIPLAKIVRAYQPNAMSVAQKIGHYLSKIVEFVTADPREANTEGGIFPAIFGTVLMVIIMAMLVTPFGVIAAVYLSEYAKQGPFTRMVRIAVNNLAGVPSVVYGVFGLGFFVYFVGGSIDRAFFSTALPTPTFGTPGLLWSALTLALLTVPVVIVATEEGLSRIPKSIREGSLALGATKAETLWRTVLPMATPGMMTGVILAIARAAGEVAPLMLVGVVKLAPSLPIDANSPYLHLDRKFMHLGFHIYDVGFQSPNVEAARPLVYATAFLLVLVIVALNLTAIRIRNRLREKYNAAES